MKKITLSAIALMAFAFTQAQDLKFGAKAGLNLANISTDYSGEDSFDDDNKMKVGFHVGGFVEIKFSEKFALQPELLFSTQGTKNEFKDEEGDYDVKTNLSYINVPVMVKFYPIEKLFIEAGPQIGFLMSAKAKYSEDVVINEDGDTDDNIDIKDGYKSIDFGMNVGVGYEFTENLFANVRYNIGLSDISEGNDDEDLGILGDYFKTRNNVLSVSLGYKF